MKSENAKYLNPPHSICELGVELKVVCWQDSLCVWLLIQDLILSTRQRMKQSNQVIVGQVQLSHNLRITQSISIIK
jgi:hypothetical protein